jgi:hypothetical protein
LPGSYAIRHPKQAARYFLAPARLARLLGHEITSDQVKHWMAEAEPITDHLRKRIEEEKWPGGKPQPGSAAAQDRGPVLYAITRALRPQQVVETGVASGASSVYFLEALRANGGGTLHSVDLPLELWDDPKFRDGVGVHLPIGKRPGWLVSDELRARWKFHAGDTRSVLPGVVSSVGGVDLFFHDSDHSYSTMTFEYSTAWPHLTAEGVLGSDDVDRNSAFGEFVRAHHLRSVEVGGFGITRKSPIPT